MSGPKGKRDRTLTDGTQELKSQYLESHGGVHQVEIQIIQLEGSKCFLAHLLHQGSLMEGGPQLWGNTKPGSCSPALRKAEHPWQGNTRHRHRGSSGCGTSSHPEEVPLVCT